ncbi:nuclease [Hoylesella buccalis]|uniref:Nuclease n=1 Tax=Hoylesella buccalis TaxID=28127 RepID=A0A2N6QRM7_9BACT|nr:PD-(D/E)XK nuclease family protein [Hoylesella buccalis]PMC24543.1 nuclease [Hoylesella buccalis]
MKNSFLKYVAQDLIAKFGQDLSRVAVVFPNKRASLFMNEQLACLSDRPIWSPSYITISDLFRRHSHLTVGDSIKLICDLHKSFNACTGSDETLDKFYGWGQLLLSDFDDIDKNMVDADKVFANLRDIHEFDDVSYLSEEQKKILQAFFKSFDEDHDTELKRRFLNLWSHFKVIYHDFNQRLSVQGIAYEGALYRQVAQNEDIEFEYEQYVFVGFNVLQKVEQALFKRLKDMGKAMFYWDFDRYYLADGKQEAGHFIRQYLDVFPNELDNQSDELYKLFTQPKDITYLSAPTENMQARYITTWLREKGRIEAGKNTAIVMCDEQLLQTVIHCIPPEAGKINITTGYPLAQSPVASLINVLLMLQTSGHILNTDKYRLAAVKRVLRHPYAQYISENHQTLLTHLETEKHYFPTRSELSVDDGLSLLFTDIDDDPTNSLLTTWILNVLKRIGQQGKDNEDAFFQESVFRMYTLINRLSDLIAAGDLTINLTTFERLMAQLIQATNIPFHGEPAEGIQVMGVLETRNLDFDHLLVLSCNEGNMPKGVSDTSFIPHTLREAYGLTTVKHKVAIYAYHFHRLIQRASDVTLTYNNSTEISHTGEMSRFMLQMMVESGHPIQRYSMLCGQSMETHGPEVIEKNEQVMQALNQLEQLSPTAINRYLRCPLQFYYNILAGLKEPEAEDAVDNRMFGNIFHRSAELIYTHLKEKNQRIQASDIHDLRTKGKRIEQFVDQAFNEELFNVSNKGYRPEYNGLQLINRRVIIDYLNRLLQIDEKLAPFVIKSLEEKVSSTLTFETAQGSHSLSIGGYIDRLDEIVNPDGTHRIRVIDYKTGKPMNSTPVDVDDIFTDEKLSEKHKDYYLQTFLYASIVKHHPQLNPAQLPVSPALLFIQQTAGEDYDPTLLLEKEKVLDIGEYDAKFKENLQQLLSEIYNPSIPFAPTSELKRCTYCPYRQLCDRNVPATSKG